MFIAHAHFIHAAYCDKWWLVNCAAAFFSQHKINCPYVDYADGEARGLVQPAAEYTRMFINHLRPDVNNACFSAHINHTYIIVRLLLCVVFYIYTISQMTRRCGI